MSAFQARVYWKALVDNASALIADAHTLLESGSHGRARSLTVLAHEKLGKALWIYDVFFDAWNTGNDDPRAVDRLALGGRSHTKKYLQACLFGDGLPSFWGDYDAIENLRQDGESWEQALTRRQGEAEAAAQQANIDKQHGFYVDRDAAGHIHSPRQMPSAGIADELQQAAQVIEMLLITDHSRMKFDAVTAYDSTHQQQRRLLPISHPEDFRAAAARPHRLATAADPE